MRTPGTSIHRRPARGGVRQGAAVDEATGVSRRPKMRHLEGHVAFVTGGSSGIGLGIARACMSAGMKVVITFLTERHADAARQQLRAIGPEFLAIKADVTDGDALQRA